MTPRRLRPLRNRLMSAAHQSLINDNLITRVSSAPVIQGLTNIEQTPLYTIHITDAFKADGTATEIWLKVNWDWTLSSLMLCGFNVPTVYAVSYEVLNPSEVKYKPVDEFDTIPVLTEAYNPVNGFTKHYAKFQEIRHEAGDFRKIR